MKCNYFRARSPLLMSRRVGVGVSDVDDDDDVDGDDDGDDDDARCCEASIVK